MRSKGPNPVDVLVGSRIRLLRKRRKMSQAELGKALGVTFQQIQKYEQGISRMACATAIQIGKILKIDLNELLGVKGVAKQAINPAAYELALELQKLSPKTRAALLKIARALV